MKYQNAQMGSLQKFWLFWADCYSQDSTLQKDISYFNPYLVIWIATYRHGFVYSYYYIATKILIKSLILICSSNIIYGYHLTGKWTGGPSGGMDYGMDNGMYSWWHPFFFDSFVPIAFRSWRIDIDVNSRSMSTICQMANSAVCYWHLKDNSEWHQEEWKS